MYQMVKLEVRPHTHRDISGFKNLFLMLLKQIKYVINVLPMYPWRDRMLQFCFVVFPQIPGN